MTAISNIQSTSFVLEQEDIDTDQIIPARFLTTTEREGLGKFAFADWRYDDDGKLIESAPINSEQARQSQILVAGNNFGCGSSREHAPWALLDFGFRVVISSEIADIFRSNALKNGLLAIVLEPKAHQYLLENPGLQMTVSLLDKTITLADGQSFNFPIDAFARHCLLEGIDQLGFLLQHDEAIRRHEAQH